MGLREMKLGEMRLGDPTGRLYLSLLSQRHALALHAPVSLRTLRCEWPLFTIRLKKPSFFWGGEFVDFSRVSRFLGFWLGLHSIDVKKNVPRKIFKKR